MRRFNSWSCVHFMLARKSYKYLKPMPLKCETSLDLNKFLNLKLQRHRTNKNRQRRKHQWKKFKENRKGGMRATSYGLESKRSTCIKPAALNLGAIYHFDFSENSTQMVKEELHSSHFNKNQYSLHCTVKHCAVLMFRTFTSTISLMTQSMILHLLKLKQKSALL